MCRRAALAADGAEAKEVWGGGERPKAERESSPSSTSLTWTDLSVEPEAASAIVYVGGRGGEKNTIQGGG